MASAAGAALVVAAFAMAARRLVGGARTGLSATAADSSRSVPSLRSDDIEWSIFGGFLESFFSKSRVNFLQKSTVVQ